MADQGSKPKRTVSDRISRVLLFVVIPLLLLALGARYVMDRQIEARQLSLPVVTSGAVPSPPPPDPKAMRSAKEIYQANCAVCHDIDMQNLWPRFGKPQDWRKRNARGLDALVETVVKGKGAMPKFGANLSHEEIVRVVVYMANAGGAEFEEDAKAKQEARIAALALHPGKTLYDTACAACHTTDVVGAPKFGDKAAWAARIKQGNDTLFKHAIEGFKGMPAKGGSAAPDAEIKAAVEYMVGAAK